MISHTENITLKNIFIAFFSCFAHILETGSIFHIYSKFLFNVKSAFVFSCLWWSCCLLPSFHRVLRIHCILHTYPDCSKLCQVFFILPLKTAHSLFFHNKIVTCWDSYLIITLPCFQMPSVFSSDKFRRTISKAISRCLKASKTPDVTSLLETKLVHIYQIPVEVV